VLLDEGFERSQLCRIDPAPGLDLDGYLAIAQDVVDLEAALRGESTEVRSQSNFLTVGWRLRVFFAPWPNR